MYDQSRDYIKANEGFFFFFLRITKYAFDLVWNWSENQLELIWALQNLSTWAAVWDFTLPVCVFKCKCFVVELLIDMSV